MTMLAVARLLVTIYISIFKLYCTILYWEPTAHLGTYIAQFILIFNQVSSICNLQRFRPTKTICLSTGFDLKTTDEVLRSKSRAGSLPLQCHSKLSIAKICGTLPLCMSPCDSWQVLCAISSASLALQNWNTVMLTSLHGGRNSYGVSTSLEELFCKEATK